MSDEKEHSCSEGVIDISPNNDGGVLKEILRPGDGDELPLKGDKVTVHYTGTLAEDGSKFDSSRDRGEKFEFTLGRGEVIKSWDIGVATMKKGELARFTCRSDYAYGANGSPPKIPPNATLVFEVELYEWKGEDLSSKKDGGIIRRNIIPGDGFQSPNEGAVTTVHLKGKCNGTVFDDREVTFTIGEGIEHDIPEGVEKALQKFKNNEKSLVKLTSKYGFGSTGNPSLNVPSNADLEYEIELKSFEKAKENWEMDQEEKIDHAKIAKERGTKFFKENKFRLALKQYKKVVAFLSYDSGLSDEKKEESASILLAGQLNLSMCYLKLNDNIHAKEHATKALEVDPKNVKAYFRRGQALLNLSEPELALAEFKTCLELDKTNKAAAQQLKACQNAIKSQKQKDKQLYGGMFDKFAKIDAKRAAANNRYGDVMAGDLGEWGNSAEKDVPLDDEDEEGRLDNLGDHIELLNSGGINGI